MSNAVPCGVTFTGAEAVLDPKPLLAVTVHAYITRPAKPITLIGEVLPVVNCVICPGAEQATV